MATPYEHAHYMTKWLIGHTHSQNARCTHPQLNRCPDNPKRACHRRARSKMEWIYIRTEVSGHGSLEKIERKKERLRKWLFFGCLDSMERGTVEWNSGTVEWNSGMGNYD